MSQTDTIGIPFPLTPNKKIPQYGLSWRVVAPGEYQAVGNHGIALFPSVLVLDCDIYKQNGRDLASEFLTWYPYMRHTRIVQTPRKGYHIYVSKPVDYLVKNKQSAYPGVDFQSNGQYVCGDGTHVDFIDEVTGEHVIGDYISVGGLAVLPCPQTFLDSLEKPAAAFTEGAAESLENEAEWIGVCKYEPPSSQGSRGFDTYRLAARGKDLALPLSVVYQHMRDFWNPRNLPPQPESDMYKECEHAYKYGRNAPGAKSASAIFSQVAEPGRPHEASRQNSTALATFGAVDGSLGRSVRSNGDQHAAAAQAPPNGTRSNNGSDQGTEGQNRQILPAGQLVNIDDFQHRKIMESIFRKQVLMDKKAELPQNTMSNIVYYLKHDEAWRGRIKYNQFTDAVEIKGRPSWRKDRKSKGEALNKVDKAYIQTWFSTNHQIEVAGTTISAAAMVAADQYHPVLEYLEGVEWDGLPRLQTAFIDTLGVANNAYTREVAVLFFLSAVKRIYEPGCKLDYVVVLESRQGWGKSQWVADIGGPFASTGELVRGDKDTYQNLRGKWVVELPEIDSTFSKQDVAWLKKVISTGSDYYRPSYGEQAEDVPRESIFVATINPSNTHEYLRDDENRRYWPIKCGRINLDFLKHNRDQYFAEAVYRYKAGESSWQMSPEAESIALIEQETRKETDPWEEDLEEWCHMTWTTKGAFATKDAFFAIQQPTDRKTSRIRERMYRVLRALGYTYHESSKKWYGKIDWGRLL